MVSLIPLVKHDSVSRRIVVLHSLFVPFISTPETRLGIWRATFVSRTLSPLQKEVTFVVETSLDLHCLDILSSRLVYGAWRSPEGLSDSYSLSHVFKTPDLKVVQETTSLSRCLCLKFSTIKLDKKRGNRTTPYPCLPNLTSSVHHKRHKLIRVTKEGGDERGKKGGVEFEWKKFQTRLGVGTMDRTLRRGTRLEVTVNTKQGLKLNRIR